MRKVVFCVALVATLVAVGVTTAVFWPSSAGSSSPLKNKVIARDLAIETGQAQRHKWEQVLSSGTMYTALQASGLLDKRAD